MPRDLKTGLFENQHFSENAQDRFPGAGLFDIAKETPPDMQGVNTRELIGNAFLDLSNIGAAITATTVQQMMSQGDPSNIFGRNGQDGQLVANAIMGFQNNVIGAVQDGWKKYEAEQFNQAQMQPFMQRMTQLGQQYDTAEQQIYDSNLSPEDKQEALTKLHEQYVNGQIMPGITQMQQQLGRLGIRNPYIRGMGNGLMQGFSSWAKDIVSASRNVAVSEQQRQLALSNEAIAKHQMGDVQQDSGLNSSNIEKMINPAIQEDWWARTPDSFKRRYQPIAYNYMLNSLGALFAINKHFETDEGKTALQGNPRAQEQEAAIKQQLQRFKTNAPNIYNYVERQLAAYSASLDANAASIIKASISNGDASDETTEQLMQLMAGVIRPPEGIDPAFAQMADPVARVMAIRAWIDQHEGQYPTDFVNQFSPQNAVAGSFSALTGTPGSNPNAGLIRAGGTPPSNSDVPPQGEAPPTSQTVNVPAPVPQEPEAPEPEAPELELLPNTLETHKATKLPSWFESAIDKAKSLFTTESPSAARAGITNAYTFSGEDKRLKEALKDLKASKNPAAVKLLQAWDDAMSPFKKGKPDELEEFHDDKQVKILADQLVKRLSITIAYIRQNPDLTSKDSTINKAVAVIEGRAGHMVGLLLNEHPASNPRPKDSHKPLLTRFNDYINSTHPDQAKADTILNSPSRD